MESTQSITFIPVTRETWPDFEKFFEAKGGPHYCWCMPWRATPEERKHDSDVARKSFMQERIFAGIPVGLLAYENGEPIAWCSVAPRETFNKLGGDETLQAVWSITCFHIRKDHRKQGLVHDLIKATQRYARENGARYLEAFPVDADSPSYRNMGFVSAFEKEGFSFIRMEGTRRHVMVLPL